MGSRVVCASVFTFLASVSGCSHRPSGAASKCFERECDRLGADHLRVQQSCHQPLCGVTMATVDQASSCGPSPREGFGRHCEGVEELHRESKRKYWRFDGFIVHVYVYIDMFLIVLQFMHEYQGHSTEPQCLLTKLFKHTWLPQPINTQTQQIILASADLGQTQQQMNTSCCVL